MNNLDIYRDLGRRVAHDLTRPGMPQLDGMDLLRQASIRARQDAYGLMETADPDQLAAFEAAVLETAATRSDAALVLTFASENAAATVVAELSEFHAAQGAVNEVVEAWCAASCNIGGPVGDPTPEIADAHAERDRVARHLAQRLLAGRVVAPSTVATTDV